MANILIPKLHTLPPAQLELWQVLSETPNDFILYGGTAIALWLGHRLSIDFDFFSPKPFDPEQLYHTIPYLKHSRIIQQAQNTLTCRVEKQDGVLISFFGDLDIKQVGYPAWVEANHIKVADLKDLAGTKAAVIQKRVEIKDYLDIEALLLSKNFTLENILSYAGAIYGKAFNPYITLRALCYFNDPALHGLSSQTKQYFMQVVKHVDVEKIPISSYFSLGTIS